MTVPTPAPPAPVAPPAPPAPPAHGRGLHSSEFWLTLAAAIASAVIGVVQHDATAAAAGSSTAAGLYAIARAMTKALSGA